MLILKRLNRPGDKCLREQGVNPGEGGWDREGIIMEVISLETTKWQLTMVVKKLRF